MILVAGGEHDTNIRILCDRLHHRSVPHIPLMVGAKNAPRIHIDIHSNTFSIDGDILSLSSCFIRNDVFFHNEIDLASAHARAINWYQAVRGWVISQPSIRLFNRNTPHREYSKIENLLAAQEVGLLIPETIVSNDFSEFINVAAERIQKPVAGGEYTTLLCDFNKSGEASSPYPRFVQTRMEKPEIRIYRIGSSMFAYTLISKEIDYRRTKDVEITSTNVPAEIGDCLMRLCDNLHLDFAAADFMSNKHGDLHFLEINSQPMFAAFDQVSEGRLCDAIIDHLMR